MEQKESVNKLISTSPITSQMKIASGEDGVVYPFTGNYIACKYDKDWYIGVVEEVCGRKRSQSEIYASLKGLDDQKIVSTGL